MLFGLIFLFIGCAMAQAVSCQPVTTEARVQAQISPREMAGKVAVGQVFPPKYFVFSLSVPFHQCNTLIFIYMLLTRRTNERSLGTFQKSGFLSEIRKHWIEKYFHFVFKGLHNRIFPVFYEKRLRTQ